MQTRLLLLATIAALAAGPVAIAGPRAHMVEAFSGEGFDRTAPVWIAPANARQRTDPVYTLMSAKLAETLTANGFKVAPEGMAKAVVTIDYAAGASGAGVGRGVSATDPSYRVVIVTGYDLTDPAKPRLTWQTVMDEYGISNDVRSTIPGLIEAGGRWFGVNKTAHSTMLASWCAANPALINSHIHVSCTGNPDKPLANRAGYITSTFVGPPENAPGPGG